MAKTKREILLAEKAQEEALMEEKAKKEILVSTKEIEKLDEMTSDDNWPDPPKPSEHDIKMFMSDENHFSPPEEGGSDANT